jgi:uncharacterized protein YndB with AHSA1/START domain
MTEQSVIHHTFTIERRYPVAPELTFQAWAVPTIKARWFAPAPGQEHHLDFRVGGLETTCGTAPDGTSMVFTSRYQDIVDQHRIVYSSTLSGDGILATISLTTLLFAPLGEQTELTLVEQATFLDGREKPEWREHGTAQWLDGLGAGLATASATSQLRTSRMA